MMLALLRVLANYVCSALPISYVFNGEFDGFLIVSGSSRVMLGIQYIRELREIRLVSTIPRLKLDNTFPAIIHNFSTSFPLRICDPVHRLSPRSWPLAQPDACPGQQDHGPPRTVPLRSLLLQSPGPERCGSLRSLQPLPHVQDQSCRYRF